MASLNVNTGPPLSAVKACPSSVKATVSTDPAEQTEKFSAEHCFVKVECFLGIAVKVEVGIRCFHDFSLDVAVDFVPPLQRRMEHAEIDKGGESASRSHSYSGAVMFRPSAARAA
jgi:hypothetical protein